MDNTKFAALGVIGIANLATAGFMAYKAKKTADKLEMEVSNAKKSWNDQLDQTISSLENLKF